MKICIPIEFQAQGGGFYFLQAFERFLVANGDTVTRKVEDQYDILFTNHWMTPRSEIIKAFRFNPNVRTAQRIDGAAQDYGRNPEADQRQRAVNLLADLTIFQSEYCRYSTREKFHVIPNDGPVIHNPVDLELFNPAGSKRTLQGYQYFVACVTWSANPMKGAASIYEVATDNSNTGFVLCGQYPDAPDLPNIIRLGVLNHVDLAEALRSCHVMLTFSQNEACPNHVIQGLASGLPVLYGDSGAMHEVIGDAGLPVTVATFADQLARIRESFNRYSELARQRAVSLFSPDDIFQRYRRALLASLDSPPRVSLVRRWVLIWLDFPKALLLR
jgi:glycosyltransferase involved in cell wall biosynthesis